MEMRVKHDVRAAASSPADRLRITPTFMADRDPECQRAGLENPPLDTGRKGSFLRGIELDFVLKNGDGCIPIDDQGGEPQSAVDNALGAEDHGDVGLRGGRPNG